MLHVFQSKLKYCRAAEFLLNKRFQSIYHKMDPPSLSQLVVVKHHQAETKFTFSFYLALPDFKINKQFNLNRELSEETESFLERLNNNLNKAKKKNSKSLIQSTSNGCS